MLMSFTIRGKKLQRDWNASDTLHNTVKFYSTSHAGAQILQHNMFELASARLHAQKCFNICTGSMKQVALGKVHTLKIPLAYVSVPTRCAAYITQGHQISLLWF
uniref:Uncharacterized protein n=1 Tax=Rhipicephalus zambeziensis TaxID=60191 RepID=A0A224YLG8_9ACAR